MYFKKPNFKLLLITILITLSGFVLLNCARAKNYFLPVGSNKAKIQEEVKTLELIQNGLASIAKNASPSVVFISVSKTITVPYRMFNPFEDFFDDFGFGFGRPRDRNRKKPKKKFEKKYKQKGAGSGFIIDSKKGYILTNNHVVGDSEEITVVTYDKKKYKAKVIGTDKHTDIAVIQVTNLPKSIKQLYLSDSHNIKVGDFAIAIGAPYELPQSFSFGVVSAKGRKSLNITDYGDFIQTDAAINPGNSGGPLLNIYGDVMGMNTAIISQTGGNIGIGFAIPSNILRDVAQRLINKGKITRAHLGVYIQDLDENLVKGFGLKDKRGALISKVEEGSPADKAGLKEGDVITKINGESIDDSSHLRLKIGMAPANQKVELEYIRKGKVNKITIKLESKDKEEETKTKEKKKSNKWGMTLESVTPKLREKYQLEKGLGLLVTDVEENSLASSAGILEGDIILSVNQKEVKSVRDFKRYDNKSSILLRILRRGMYLFLQISK